MTRQLADGPGSMPAINTNSPSLIAQRHFSQVNLSLNATMEKLATGSRINRGSDDPAGLISSEQLSAALAALEAESRVIERADSVANIADGALSEISGLLSDANAATVAMANTAGMSQAERDAYQMEIDSAMQTIDRIASTTTFNGRKVLDGSMSLSVGGASISIGSASLADIGQSTGFRLSDVVAGGSLDPMTNPAGAQQAIAGAISEIATMRGQTGSFQKDSLGSMQRSNAAAFENTASAYSAIRDTDYAAESANLSRGQLLRASSLSVLALANSAPRSALHFLA